MKNHFWKVIGFVFLCLLFVGLVFTYITLEKIKTSAAFSASKIYIENNGEFKSSIGEIEGYGFLIGTEMEEGARSGFADFEYKVYGTKNNYTIDIYLVKDSLGNWNVKEFNYK